MQIAKIASQGKQLKTDLVANEIVAGSRAQFNAYLLLPCLFEPIVDPAYNLGHPRVNCGNYVFLR